MTILRSLSQLVARILIGVILIAHGWSKFSGGIANSVEGFSSMGVPLASIAAPAAAVTEIGAGVLLIIGFLTPLAGALTAAVMAGAYLFAHTGGGIFVADGGWELVGAIGAGGLALAAGGAGQLSVDALLSKRTSTA